MSSKRFEHLASDLGALKEQLEKKMCSGLDRQVAEGDTILKLMQTELLKVPLHSRSDLQASYDRRNREWNSLKRRLVLSTNKSSSTGPSETPTALKLEQGRKILQDTNQSVYRATVVAQENHQIGVEVMSELGVQRDALVRTRDRLVEADQDLSRSHKILRSMNRRVYTNKFLLIIIIVMELVILLAIVYIRFIKKKD